MIVPLNTGGVYSKKANLQKTVCHSGDEAISTGESCKGTLLCQVTSKEKCIDSTRKAKLKHLIQHVTKEINVQTSLFKINHPTIYHLLSCLAYLQ